MSTTDLKGRILYCNPSFITVSGFAREELLGQPHNVIRHPDMPEEAFRDMWETISNGLPWSAPVKNRRKNGSCYWVVANVTPLMDRDRPIGYLSVRTEASRPQIQQAERLYATMAKEKQAGHLVHKLQGGRIVRNTLMGRMIERLRPGTQAKVSGVVLGVTAVSGLASRLVNVEGWEMTAAAVLASLAAAGAGGWVLGRMLIAPLREVLRFTNTMAAGDLTQQRLADRAALPGDLARALNQLNVSLQSIVRDARGEAEQMREATTEIASGNQNLSQRTETQASNLEETAASLEQITATVKHTADSARTADELARTADAVTVRSSDAVRSAAQTMQAIRESSSRIKEIIGVIDSIAFQTNILALNAAVEAARAGEQGRGFAVVASEVRALSQRTSEAAREVKALIEDAANKVEAGNQLTEAAKAAMSESQGAVQRVTQLISEISTAANQQLSGISQINTSVSELESITTQNAALVEQIAASATSLQAQSDAVTETVKVFRIGAHDHTGDAVALRRAMKAKAAA